MAAGVIEEPVIPGGTGVLVETAAEHEAFPPFDSTTFASQLLWLAITFGIFYYLMARVIVPRMAGIIEDRRDRVASDLDMADRLKSDSADALAGYERALGQARNRAFGIAEAAREEARAGADARRAEVEEGLNRKLAIAEARIAEIKQAALAEVGAIAVEATSAIVKRLIDADIARPEIERAVSDLVMPSATLDTDRIVVSGEKSGGQGAAVRRPSAGRSQASEEPV